MKKLAMFSMLFALAFMFMSNTKAEAGNHGIQRVVVRQNFAVQNVVVRRPGLISRIFTPRVVQRQRVVQQQVQQFVAPQQLIFPSVQQFVVPSVGYQQLIVPRVQRFSVPQQFIAPQQFVLPLQSGCLIY